MMGFIYAQLGELDATLGFMGGLLVAMGFLTLIAWGIRALFRNVMPKKASFSLRQGLANLYRPNNQTLLMIVSTGLGTFLISTIFLTQDILLNQMDVSAGEDQPNMVLFDVQYDQQNEVERILNENNLNIKSKTPIVTMRLAAVNGRSVGELKRDTTSKHDGWVLEREWRVSYRDTLNEGEIITEGTFTGSVPSETALVPVSLSTDLQDDLDVQLGDTLTYDVQGVPIQTTVASFRKVDWQQFSTNFFLIFPEGILENAPQFYVYLANYSDENVAAKVKNELVQSVPNVSVIDLSLVLETVRGILYKIQYAVQFMAMFSILTGLVVLISSLIINRDQRVKESVLLRTLGAVKSKIKAIQFVEFTFLGVIASMTGALLSIGSSYALSRFVFQSDFYISWMIVGLTFVGVTAVVVAIGLSNSRGIADRPPLDILREEM
jgi:putative ABC transport system permease protein